MPVRDRPGSSPRPVQSWVADRSGASGPGDFGRRQPHNPSWALTESFDRIKVLTRGDEPDGGQLFPGFRLRLDSFFEEAEDDGPEVAD